MISFDIELQHKGKIIAGVDEVGRGPLAGPVVAAAVIANPDLKIDGINDSKKIPKKKREEINELIVAKYLYSIGEASAREIEEFGIVKATALAMTRAVNALSITPAVVLVDGNMKWEDPRYISIIKGDTLSISIAAASIVAKVYRDKLMSDLSALYPEYGFEKHSGYGTLMHVAALKKYGPSPAHRKNFITNIHF